MREEALYDVVYDSSRDFFELQERTIHGSVMIVKTPGGSSRTIDNHEIGQIAWEMRTCIVVRRLGYVLSTTIGRIEHPVWPSKPTTGERFEERKSFQKADEISEGVKVLIM